MSDQLRELTDDEVRDRFLQMIWLQIDFWEHHAGNRSRRDLLAGMAHSVLAILDGNVGTLPAWIVAPTPHPDDRTYQRAEGEPWYPENDGEGVRADIAGSLAYEMYRYAERHGIDKGE